MLMPNEAKGLRDILNGLSTEDLLSITDTITKRMIVVESRDEAIDAILTFTEKPSDLLRRQKITKKALFNYIRNEKIIVSPDASKADFIRACLTSWLSKETYQDNDHDDQPESEHSRNNEQPEHNKTNIVQTQTIASQQYVVNESMGVEFSKWFFSMLNSLSEFGPQHFWPDCKLSVEYKLTNNDIQIYTFSTSCDVATFFSNLVSGEKYYFDPNSANEAVQFTLEQHGLVKLEISGVLHQHANCVGLFDSRFGLVRNPMQEYNWKIKMIQMKIQIRSSNNQSIASNHYYLNDEFL